MLIQNNVLNADGTISVESVRVVTSSTTDELGNPVKVTQIDYSVPIEDPAPVEEPAPVVAAEPAPVVAAPVEDSIFVDPLLTPAG